MQSSALDGRNFKNLFIAGSKRIDESKEYLNSINVFPVPDGDTGSNMASTMNYAVDALNDIEDHSLQNVLNIIAHELRMEAKGNSGIILSEFFHGMFQKIKNEDSISPENFIAALENGRQAAYQALADPVEGTILTLITDSVRLLTEMQSEIDDMKSAVERMVDIQRKALAQTTEIMPLLKENQGNKQANGASGTRYQRRGI